MPLLVFGIVAVWTLVLFRVICFRTTLGARTLLTFLALGALLGTTANPLVEKFFNSYRYEGNQLYVLLILLCQHILMVAPVLILLMRPAWRYSSSVCDAFLSAFMIGAGYEFLGALMALAPAQNVSTGLAFFPPGVASTSTLTVGGYGYWNGLVALALVLCFRRLRKPIVAYSVAGLALLLTVLDHYGATANVPLGEKIRTVTLHGNLLPWLLLVLLIGAVILEMISSKADGKEAIAEFQAVASSAIGFKWNQARLTSAGYHLRRQAQILAAEHQSEPGNEQIQRLRQSVDSSLAKLASITPAPSSSPIDWLKKCWPQVLAVAVFVCFAIFLVMPSMNSVSNWIWTSLPFAVRFAPFQLTLLATLLVVLLMWQYVSLPWQAFSRTISDEVGQFAAEQWIVRLGVGVLLIALLYPHPGEFTAFQSNLARGANIQVPGFNEVQVLTLLLLLALSVGTLTVKRAELWHKMAGSGYLNGLAHNFITLCTLSAVSWLALVFFTQAQIFAHANFGVAFFNYFGTNGNSMLEMVLGLVTIAFGFGATWLVRLVAFRIEQKLDVSSQESVTPRAAGARQGASL